MTTVSVHYDHVVGVDTHARTHTFCILHAATGTVIDTASFPASTAGNTRALTWIRNRSDGKILAAVEGTSSYGTAVTELLSAESIDVTEVTPMATASRSNVGKSDAIDAESAARRVHGQPLNRLTQPRAKGIRSALRVLLASRSLIDHQRTANRNALTALLRTNDLGFDARQPLTNTQIRAIASWRIARNNQDTPTGVARVEARRLAKAVLANDAELSGNHKQLDRLVNKAAPGLQDEPGIGPITAAILLTAYSHKGRIRSEAAFASLAGVAPQPASSGNTTRHRLSRSGDRQLNRALDIIVRTRMSHDPETKDYIARRRAEGRTNREIRRCLKRYVARATFRKLETIMA